MVRNFCLVSVSESACKYQATAKVISYDVRIHVDGFELSTVVISAEGFNIHSVVVVIGIARLIML